MCVHICLYFSWFLFCFSVLVFHSGLIVFSFYLPVCFLNRERKRHGVGWVQCGEDLEGDQGGEISDQNILFGKKFIFNKVINRKKKKNLKYSLTK